MEKYFVLSRYGWTGAKIEEFLDDEAMLEFVRKENNSTGVMPVVFYGRKLEFEPAEVVKSWKVKDQ